MPVPRPPRNGLEDESRRELGRDWLRQWRHEVESIAVPDELVEEPDAYAAIEQLREVGCVPGAPLHRVGRDAGGGDEYEEVLDDRLELRVAAFRLHAASQRVVERRDAYVLVERRFEARQQLGAIGSRDRQRPFSVMSANGRSAHSKRSAPLPST